MITRRNFLKLTGGVAATAFSSLLAACAVERTIAGMAAETPEGQQEAGRLVNRGAPTGQADSGVITNASAHRPKAARSRLRTR
jgi:hypothetical protein